VVSPAQQGGLTSDEHFSADGTLIEAWASQKSFRAKDGSGGGNGSGRNPHVDFHGQQRRNDTHASTTDPEAKLYRKGHSHELSYLGHVVIENGNALVMACEVSEANGHAKPQAATRLLERTPRKGRAARSCARRRASVRVDEGGRGAVAGQASRASEGRLALRAGDGGVHPDKDAQAATGGSLRRWPGRAGVAEASD
jgi:hypothetical protein